MGGMPVGQAQLIVPAQAVVDDLFGVPLNDRRPLAVDGKGMDDLLLLVGQLLTHGVEVVAEIELVRTVSA